MSIDVPKLKEIAKKAKILEDAGAMGIAKEFVSLGDKMVEIDDKLSGIINKEEEIVIELEII